MNSRSTWGPFVFWREVGRQLRHPTGCGGRLIGWIMAFANRRPNEIAIQALRICAGDIVLELGFGPGRAVRRVVRLVPTARILGIDQSAAMLALASSCNRKAIASGQVELRRGEFAKLPFRDESIDKILAVNIAYFFGGEGVEWREARRVLRDGGVMAVYVSDQNAMSHWPFAGSDTHRCYAIDDLIVICRYAGFGPHEISITPLLLPFGVTGILAILRKQSQPPDDGVLLK